MDEQAFREHVERSGYRESRVIELEPNKGGEMHAHDVSSVGMVIRGSVRIEFEREAVFNGPGEFCDVKPGLAHNEKAGPEGATVLLFWKEA